MSTAHPRGNVSASVIAGPLVPGNQAPTNGMHILSMDDCHLFIHITPEDAQQWIDVLAPIAEEASK
jgi:hypothetical protein